MYPLPQSTFSRGPSTALERRGLMFCTMVSTCGQSSRTLETKALAPGRTGAAVTRATSTRPVARLWRTSTWRTSPVPRSSW
ncbi:Uncharacterised protein [Flavonifractor plautii]|uniref:Uncharacterized protein n=1 Tax=Flavonifractor plautii TaxID=292800 RepID=A0A174WBT8_FLAPL|nr:Uncharacterised protein [Flavonifractor plautii]